MLKLIKYEYRRNLTGMVSMLGGLLLAQVFFLYATFRKDTEMVMSAMALLVFASIICVLGMMIFSVALYSRELNSKNSYLTFMTPNSMVKILAAKLVATLILGSAFAVIVCLLASWDYSLASRTFPEIGLGEALIEEVLRSLGSSFSEAVAAIAAIGVQFLVNFFTIVVVAYLAITLSATTFQNKKFKGLVSFVIFVAIMALLQWFVSKLDTYSHGGTFLERMLNMWPQYLSYLVTMIGAFALSAWLLEKKVSL